MDYSRINLRVLRNEGFMMKDAQKISESVIDDSRFEEARVRAIQEAAAICEAYYWELRNQSPLDRPRRSGVGADEESIEECFRRILALVSGGP